MTSTKDRIDAVLGIDGHSIDSMLNDLDIKTDEVQQQIDEIGVHINEKVEDIDKSAGELTNGVGSILQINELNTSLKELETLIFQAKNVFQHVVDNITSSDLIDSELVHAASSFLESIHLNVKEFIDIYKSKAKFVEKLKVMVLQQEQKKELMQIKHQYDMELAGLKNANNNNVVDAENMVSFNTDDIAKMLAENGKNKTEI